MDVIRDWTSDQHNLRRRRIVAVDLEEDTACIERTKSSPEDDPQRRSGSAIRFGSTRVIPQAKSIQFEYRRLLAIRHRLKHDKVVPRRVIRSIVCCVYPDLVVAMHIQSRGSDTVACIKSVD